MLSKKVETFTFLLRLRQSIPFAKAKNECSRPPRRRPGPRPAPGVDFGMLASIGRDWRVSERAAETHIAEVFFMRERFFFLRSGRVSNALPHAPLCSPPTPIFKTGFRIARAHSDPCGRSFTQIPAAEGSQGTVCRGYIAGSSFSTLPFDQSQVCDAIFETACRLKAAVGSPRSIRSSIWTAWTVVQDLDQEK